MSIGNESNGSAGNSLPTAEDECEDATANDNEKINIPDGTSHERGETVGPALVSEPTITTPSPPTTTIAGYLERFRLQDEVVESSHVGQRLHSRTSSPYLSAGVQPKAIEVLPSHSMRLTSDLSPEKYSAQKSNSLDSVCGQVSATPCPSYRTYPPEANSEVHLEKRLAKNNTQGRKYTMHRTNSSPSLDFSNMDRLHEDWTRHVFSSHQGTDVPVETNPRTMLQPVASIQDCKEASAVRERNRATLIWVLERQKLALKRQLEQIRNELSSQNIFSLVTASNASLLQYVLKNKLCDVNERDYNGCTPLHVAALEGNEVIMRVLISFGADIMAVDNTGRTPLDWAAANRHSSICRYLFNATQRLMVLQKQQNERISLGASAEGEDTESSDKKLQQSVSPPVTIPNNPLGQINMMMPSMRDGCSFAQVPRASFSFEAEGGIEQRYDICSASFLSCFPPDVLPLIRSRHEAIAHATEEGEVNSGTDDEDEGEEHDVSTKFSTYSTISGTESLIVCMVGLPGRGKSFIARRLSRYLNWKGVPCCVFNAGNYRRQLIGVEGTIDPSFYDPTNMKGTQLRDKMANLACTDLVEFISSHRVAVGVFDATNTTSARRRYLVDFLNKETKKKNVECRIIFIESICTDDNIITENILRAKCGNDDFKNVKDTDEVIASFRSRIVQYEKVYQPLDKSEDLSFIRIVDVKQHVLMEKIPCGLASRIAFFLLNLHPVAYPIYIALPGETEGDRNQVWGGNEHLTPSGEKFAQALKKFIVERYVPHMIVLHGTNHSVMDTLKPLSQALHDDNGDIVSRSDVADYGDENYNTTAVNTNNGSSISLTCEQELLCPLPGLDSINYGWFSGRTAEWVRKKYPRLSRLLYAGSPVDSGEPIYALGNPDNGNTDRIVDMGPKAKSEKDENMPRIEHEGGKIFFKQHFDKSAQAIRRFRHIPDGADPCLSYCVQFPNGESCRQVNVRLEPALMAVMRVQGPVVVVASSVPAQGILAFFADVMPEMAPLLRLPMHAVVEIGVKGDIIVHQLLKTPGDHLGLEL